MLFLLAKESPGSPSSTYTPYRYLKKLLWQFFPDMLSVLLGLLLSTLGLTTRAKDPDMANFLLYMAVPSVTLLLIIVLFMQQGSDRFNASRLLLETWPLHILGYNGLHFLIS